MYICQRIFKKQIFSTKLKYKDMQTKYKLKLQVNGIFQLPADKTLKIG